MSDLVKRLRKQAHDARWSTMPTECTPGIDIDDAEEAAERIEQLETTLQEAIKLMSEAAREAGFWKGKYEAAGYPGTLNDWIEKAEALEAENARLREALADRAVSGDTMIGPVSFCMCPIGQEKECSHDPCVRAALKGTAND